jgi:hypothetical protein
MLNHRWGYVTVLVLCLALAATSAAQRKSKGVVVPAGPPPGAHPILHLSFIGDAGSASASNDAPIRAIGRTAQKIDTPELTVFLGDNVYDNGLAPEGDGDRSRGERVLDRQLAVFDEDTTMRGLFISGNHDWDGMGSGGREAVTREGEYIRRASHGRISLVPDSAAPGPVVVLRNDVLQVIALDSQWWLHGYSKPHYPGRPEVSAVSGAPSDSATEEAIADSLYGLLNDFGGKASILLMHHPLETYGPHGGYFGLQDHIFPLTNVVPWLWLPLPIIGSVYPLARSNGYSAQDVSSEEYQKFIRMIGRAVNAATARGRYNVFIASGHEHALQVIQPKNDLWYLVSGNGILDHSSELSDDGPYSVFASRTAGYMTLDVYEDGGATLRVIGLADNWAEPEILFEEWIPGKDH